MILENNGVSRRLRLRRHAGPSRDKPPGPCGARVSTRQGRPRRFTLLQSHSARTGAPASRLRRRAPPNTCPPSKRHHSRSHDDVARHNAKTTRVRPGERQRIHGTAENRRADRTPNYAKGRFRVSRDAGCRSPQPATALRGVPIEVLGAAAEAGHPHMAARAGASRPSHTNSPPHTRDQGRLAGHGPGKDNRSKPISTPTLSGQAPTDELCTGDTLDAPRHNPQPSG